MPILGPLIGGGLSLVSALMGQGARRDATNLGYLNLYETRRANQAQEQEQRRVNDLIEQLQKATRTDPLGNRIRFDEGLGSFETELTPLTEAILSSQQNEQLRQVREDAPRNRAAAERRDRRSRQADEAFDKLFRDFRFRDRGSEAESVSDATQELLRARREGLKEAQGDIATTLLRQGGSSNLPAVTGQIADQYGDSLADVLLQGKRIGRQRFQEDEANNLANMLRELGGIQSIAKNTTTSPVARDNTAERLTSRSDQALQQLISALSSGSSNLSNIIGQGANRESNAIRDISRSVSSNPLDLTGVARYLSQLSLPQQEEQDMYEFPPAPPPFGVGLY